MDEVTKEAIRARNEYVEALTAVQAEMKPVVKNAENPYFKSKYADLMQVVEHIKPLLKKHGFAYSSSGIWHDGQQFCRTWLHHIGGHSEYSDYCVLFGSDPQKNGSAWTYARRYSLSALVGLVVESEDDDAEVATRVAAPQTQAQSAPAQSDILLTTIVAANAKESVTKTGKTQYAIMDGAKSWYSTLNEKYGTMIMDAYDQKQPITIAFKFKDKFKNIVRVWFPAVNSETAKKEISEEREMSEVPF